jgi:hypothetical protein
MKRISPINNQTIVRYLDYDNNQLAVDKTFGLKLTADYALVKT